MTAPIHRQPPSFPADFLRQPPVACSYTRWIVGHPDLGYLRDEGSRVLIIPAAVQARLLQRRDELHDSVRAFLLSENPHADGAATDLWQALCAACVCLQDGPNGGLWRRLLPDAEQDPFLQDDLIRSHEDVDVVRGTYAAPTPDRDLWDFDRQIDPYLHWTLTDRGSGREYVMVPESVQEHLTHRFSQLAQYTQMYLTENQPGGIGGPHLRTRVRLGTAFGTVTVARQQWTGGGISDALDLSRADLAA